MRTLLAFLFLASTASAEIIIDDFTVPQRLELPRDTDDFGFTVQNVGDFGGQRSIRVPAFGVEPTGFIDVGEVEPSAVVIESPNTPRNGTGASPTMSFNFTWGLDPDAPWTDLTEDGQNDAFFLRFNRAVSSTPLDGVELRATDGVDIAGYTSGVGLPLLNTPFELAFPFDSFTVDRGPGTGEFDFSTVTRMNVYIDIAFFDDDFPEDPGISIAIDSFRVGRMVPEPSSLGLVLALASGLLFYSWRCRDGKRCGICVGRSNV